MKSHEQSAEANPTVFEAPLQRSSEKSPPRADTSVPGGPKRPGRRGHDGEKHSKSNSNIWLMVNDMWGTHFICGVIP